MHLTWKASYIVPMISLHLQCVLIHTCMKSLRLNRYRKNNASSQYTQIQTHLVKVYITLLLSHPWRYRQKSFLVHLSRPLQSLKTSPSYNLARQLYSICSLLWNSCFIRMYVLLLYISTHLTAQIKQCLLYMCSLLLGVIWFPVIE